jgi:hypothetical protein
MLPVPYWFTELALLLISFMVLDIMFGIFELIFYKNQKRAYIKPVLRPLWMYIYIRFIKPVTSRIPRIRIVNDCDDHV